ncbi:MAG: hypothetical protein Q7W56_12460 [Candidatus Latescibacteria bacterium]|nr:hypothetical protein [Candidatus Latescibacterota bacterium]
MSDVSTFRLYLLRAMYLLMAVGLGVTVWPGILAPGNVSHMGSVVRSMLGALALVALWGLRHPVKMLPMLLFEFMWKVIWVVAFALAPWLNGQLDAARQETLFACLMGVVLVPIAVPWGYVFQHYVKAPGDRWHGKGAGAQQGAPADVARPAGERRG